MQETGGQLSRMGLGIIVSNQKQLETFEDLARKKRQDTQAEVQRMKLLQERIEPFLNKTREYSSNSSTITSLISVAKADGTIVAATDPSTAFAETVTDELDLGDQMNTTVKQEFTEDNLPDHNTKDSTRSPNSSTSSDSTSSTHHHRHHTHKHKHHHPSNRSSAPRSYATPSTVIPLEELHSASRTRIRYRDQLDHQNEYSHNRNSSSSSSSHNPHHHHHSHYNHHLSHS